MEMAHVLAMKSREKVASESVEITLKLFAMLERWLPEGARRNEIRLSVPAGTTPSEIISALDLPEPLCALVLVNGAFVEHDLRAVRRLAPGDALSIWPPIAGG